MFWLFEEYTYPSGTYGTITAKRVLGRWWVTVDKCGMTTPYTHDMWDTALAKTKAYATKSPASVLMLGLGAGGQIKTLYKHFPGCSITAVEYDPAMIALFDRLRLYTPFAKPTVLAGDAQKVVTDLTGPYSLIMIDLFIGPDPAPFVSSPNFLHSIEKLLSPDGLVLLNANTASAYIDAAAQILTQKARWQYKTNHLALYGKQ